MLKQIDKDKLKKIGIDIDAIIVAHTDAAEKDIVVPDGELLTADQLRLRDENTKKEGVKEGEKAALPLAIAEINKATGLTIDPTKVDRFGELGKQLNEKLTATNDDKLKTANQQVKDLLKDKEDLTKERDTFKLGAEKTSFEYQQFKHLPDDRAKHTSESEYLALLQMRGVEPKTDGVYRNGELMKDPITKGPLQHKDAYKTLFDEFNWKGVAPAGAQGGRGGGNSSGGAATGKARTQTEAIGKWKEANPGKNEMSPECQTFVMTEAKDNTTFDWNN